MSQSDPGKVPDPESPAEPPVEWADSGRSSRWTRRTFLKLAAVGGGAAAVGYPLVRIGMWWNRRAGDGLAVLSPDEFQIVESMAEAMFPPGGPLEYSAKHYNVAFFIDGQFAAMDPDLLRFMKAALHALEDMTMVDDWGLTPFTSRPLAERAAILQAWEKSPLVLKRSVLRLYKWYICMGLCEVPGVLDRLGVDYLCS